MEEKWYNEVSEQLKEFGWAFVDYEICECDCD